MNLELRCSLSHLRKTIRRDWPGTWLESELSLQTHSFVCVPHRPLSTSGLVCFLHFPHGMIRVLIYPSTHERIFIMKKK